MLFSELLVTDKAKAAMFAAGMYLPGFTFRATFASAVFVILFYFITDWISADTVSNGRFEIRPKEFSAKNLRPKFVFKYFLSKYFRIPNSYLNTDSIY